MIQTYSVSGLKTSDNRPYRLFVLPNSLVSMLIYFCMLNTDEGYIPIFSYTKLFLADPRHNNKVLFSRAAQET